MVYVPGLAGQYAHGCVGRRVLVLYLHHTSRSATHYFTVPQLFAAHRRVRSKLCPGMREPKNRPESKLLHGNL